MLLLIRYLIIYVTKILLFYATGARKLKRNECCVLSRYIKVLFIIERSIIDIPFYWFADFLVYSKIPLRRRNHIHYRFSGIYWILKAAWVR